MFNEFYFLPLWHQVGVLIKVFYDSLWKTIEQIFFQVMHLQMAEKRENLHIFQQNVLINIFILGSK